MNFKRVASGFILSFIFLGFFVYFVLNLKPFAENSFYSIGTTEDLLGGISHAVELETPETLVESQEIDSQANLPPKIDAQSALSVESDLYGQEKIIFEKDSKKILPIASITKLMTAMIVLDNCDLSAEVVISESADAVAAQKQDIKLGDKLSAEKLLQIMIVGSSNKAAQALSELAEEQGSNFIFMMNQKAQEIGMQNTIFADPTGLSSENVSTAEDLVKMASYILKNYSKIADISKSKELEIEGFGKIENTDQMLGEISEAVCSKTGYTLEARGCLLLVINNVKNNNYLINVILGADDRFLEMKKIINWSNKICN